MDINLTDTTKYPPYKWFLGLSLIFLDFGILFGALNSFRLAQVFNVPEIHRTHWTTTLFGAMYLLMVSQIYLIIRSTVDDTSLSPNYMYLVLGITLLGMLGSYLGSWIDVDLPFSFYDLFVYSIKLAGILFFLIIFIEFLQNKEWKILSDRPSLSLLYFATIWQLISLTGFFGFEGQALNEVFLSSYIYGFFSFTLFGVLSEVLPWLYNLDGRSKFASYRDALFINISAILISINGYMEEVFHEEITILGLLGSIFWGLVGFLFILYVFDTIYKSGLDYPLAGLSVALIFFGFFVFDTFMKSVFPQWVTASHVHFMFQGTLILTIVSVGLSVVSQKLGDDYNPTDINLRMVSLGLSILFVFLILFCFTFLLWELAGYFGLGLFISIIIAEFSSIKVI